MTCEIRALINCFQVVFLKGDIQHFRDNIYKCQRQKLLLLANIHGVRPLLYSALLKAGIEEDFRSELQVSVIQMAMREKFLKEEAILLLSRLNSCGVHSLPYKGFYFTDALNGGKMYRESSDIDLVIRDKQMARKGIELLIEEGYQVIGEVEGVNVFDVTFGRQISLRKNHPRGFVMQVDFHWGINEKYHQYTIDNEDFFEGEESREGIPVPGQRGLFAMLLNHHGARGCWLRLKEVFDFALFLNGTLLSEKERAEIASNYKMRRIYEVGLNLVKSIVLETDVRSNDVTNIIKYWSLDPSMDLNKWSVFVMNARIYLDLQDKSILKSKLAWEFVRHQGSYFPQYNYYFRPFEGKYFLLNFLFKYSTILGRILSGRYKL
jgi:hypothetical protein